MPNGDRTWPRRWVLGGLGLASIVSLAGCLDEAWGGGLDPDESGPPGGDDRGEPDDEFLSHPGDGPREYPTDHICDGVCGMAVAEYPNWNAQAAYANERGTFFCSAGCLIASLVAPDHVGVPEADLVGVWVSEFESGETIDGLDAHYVLEDDEDRHEEPMGLNPRPFADRADALAYVEDVPSLAEPDVIELDAFDLDTARIYRGHALPDTLD